MGPGPGRLENDLTEFKPEGAEGMVVPVGRAGPLPVRWAKFTPDKVIQLEHFRVEKGHTGRLSFCRDTAVGDGKQHVSKPSIPGCCQPICTCN